MLDEVIDGADLGHHVGRLIGPDPDNDLDGNLDREIILGDDRQLIETGFRLIVPVDVDVGRIDDIGHKRPTVEIIPSRTGNLFLNAPESLGYDLLFLAFFFGSPDLGRAEAFLHLLGGFIADIGNDNTYLAAFNDDRLIDCDTEHEGGDIVSSGPQHVQLRAALPLSGQKGRAVLVIVMAGYRMGDIFSFRQGNTVQGSYQAKLVGFNDYRRCDLN